MSIPYFPDYNTSYLTKTLGDCHGSRYTRNVYLESMGSGKFAISPQRIITNTDSQDFPGNQERIIESIRQAKAAGASLRIGPELGKFSHRGKLRILTDYRNHRICKAPITVPRY